MGRLRSLLAMLLVLTTGSALTLACAFVCDSAQAAKTARSAQMATHCHGGGAGKFPPGEGFRPSHEVCPVMDSFRGSEARTLQSVPNTPASEAVVLPFESSLLAVTHARLAQNPVPSRLPILKPSPPFLRNLVLRL